jgi:hypothetical protein
MLHDLHPLRIGLLAAFLASGSACASDKETPVTPSDTGGDCARNPVTSREVTAQGTFGTLYGSLALPAGCGQWPAYLIIAGSGPTDRDGNGGAALRTDAYRQLAEGLAERGVASLRYDKAGVGASGAALPASPVDLRFAHFVADAAQFLRMLREEPALSRVLVAGHSEGSLIGMLAASQTPIGGFASLAGAGRPVGVLLREQLAAQLAGTLLERSEQIIAELEAGRTVSEIPPELASVFDPSVQPYLISWMPYDPSVELNELQAPALIVQGTTDIQVSTRDAELLAAARPDASSLIVEGMNHVLKAASLDTAAQQAAYSDPSLPVVTDVLEALAEFATQ